MSTSPGFLIHPGEILSEEFMVPLGLSQNQLARDLHVDPRRINEIVLQKRGITVDTALRLSRYFRTTLEFWLNLQRAYEVGLTRDVQKIIVRQVKPRRLAS